VIEQKIKEKTNKEEKRIRNEIYSSNNDSGDLYRNSLNGKEKEVGKVNITSSSSSSSSPSSSSPSSPSSSTSSTHTTHELTPLTQESIGSAIEVLKEKELDLLKRLEMIRKEQEDAVRV
jgi:hypothetical protein